MVYTRGCQLNFLIAESAKFDRTQLNDWNLINQIDQMPIEFYKFYNFFLIEFDHINYVQLTSIVVWLCIIEFSIRLKKLC